MKHCIASCHQKYENNIRNCHYIKVLCLGNFAFLYWPSFAFSINLKLTVIGIIYRYAFQFQREYDSIPNTAVPETESNKYAYKM